MSKRSATAAAAETPTSDGDLEKRYYKDEVLGRNVEILWIVDDRAGNSTSQFFEGTITKMKVQLDKNGDRLFQHYVKFDDGTNRWFDLVQEEDEDRLKWPDDAAAATDDNDTAAHHHGPPEQKKIKTEGSTAALVKDEDDNESKVKKEEEEADEVLLDSIKKEEEEEETPPTAANDEAVGHGEQQDVDDDNNNNNQNPGDGVDDHGENQDGGDDDNNNNQNPASLPEPPFPDSIDGIIRYMDEQEPEEEYFERQQDSRGGCSGTRGKLRKFAKQNPDHPAVHHYVTSKKWQPPNAESFVALMELIKSMIRK